MEADMADENEKLPEGTGDPAAVTAEQEAEAARVAEEEAAQALQEAKDRDADKAELEALRAEKTQWATEREELEKKAKRVVQAPKTKTEKAAETPPASEETAPKRKARVSSRWFGDAAYED
jgi:hypothetical protein